MNNSKTKQVANQQKHINRPVLWLHASALDVIIAPFALSEQWNYKTRVLSNKIAMPVTYPTSCEVVWRRKKEVLNRGPEISTVCIVIKFRRENLFQTLYSVSPSAWHFVTNQLKQVLGMKYASRATSQFLIAKKKTKRGSNAAYTTWHYQIRS